MGSEAGRTVKAVARSAVRQASEAVPPRRPDLARAYRKRWSAKAQRRRTAGPQLKLVSRRGLPYVALTKRRPISCRLTGGVDRRVRTAGSRHSNRSRRARRPARVDRATRTDCRRRSRGIPLASCARALVARFNQLL